MPSVKHQLHQLLREKQIPYTTSHTGTQLQTVSIMYQDELETVIMRDARKPEIHFTTPYATASTLFEKYIWFSQVIARMRIGSGFYRFPANLN